MKGAGQFGLEYCIVFQGIKAMYQYAGHQDQFESFMYSAQLLFLRGHIHVSLTIQKV